MKKLLSAALIVFISSVLIHAHNVPVPLAQKTAGNFFTRQSGITVQNISLAYTCQSVGSPAPAPLYYVFNVNTDKGFVIVSAQDALSPVIGYSAEGSWVMPLPGTNIYYWMQKTGAQAEYVMTNNIRQTNRIAAEWSDYSGDASPSPRFKRPQAPQQVAPLCQSLWNQSPYYNALCPGGSVTGCVATAMAQVMRYWSYPPHGIDSSFYTETSPENYGLLKANYNTSSYQWGSMPYSINANNNQIAMLMYDCGVSVDMSYSPGGSGAWVITADNRICAQTSYVKYFGYNANTIQGLKRKNFNDSVWMTLIKNELNHNRVVQYAGWDSVNGGHTWVCDGYDTNSNLHMNWGWGGFDDGFFLLDTLNPYPYFFSKNEEILIGIQPPPVKADFEAAPATGCTGIQVNFTDRSFVYNNLDSITSWQWSFPGGTPSSSGAKNPTVLYNTSGVYPVTLIVTNANGSDTLTRNTFINVNGINALPFAESFEGAGNFPPPQWAINNPWQHSAAWHLYNGTGGYGNSAHCMYFNNCQSGVPGERDQIYTPAYNFSSLSKPALLFDVAYAPYNQTYSDTLAVYYSLDCGNTFTRVYLKGGMNLCTTGGQTVFAGANQDMNGCFVPLNNNWRTDTIQIPAIAGQSSVMFAFENRSGNGSNLYVDNINVPLALGLNQLGITNDELRIIPNPNNGIFQIASSHQLLANSRIEIYNMLGQKVYSHYQITKSSNYQIDLSNQPSGVYLYRVVSPQGENMAEGKFIIVK